MKNQIKHLKTTWVALIELLAVVAITAITTNDCIIADFSNLFNQEEFKNEKLSI